MQVLLFPKKMRNKNIETKFKLNKTFIKLERCYNYGIVYKELISNKLLQIQNKFDMNFFYFCNKKIKC